MHRGSHLILPTTDFLPSFAAEAILNPSLRSIFQRRRAFRSCGRNGDPADAFNPKKRRQR
jgi:hypothetical protein